MKILVSVLVLCLVGDVAKGEPFFGNNYVVPHVTELTRNTKAIVENLSGALSTVSSYYRTPPTNAENLREGASNLVQYCGNVSVLIGNVYRQIDLAVNDKQTSSPILFFRINQALKDAKPFLKNSTTLINPLTFNFNYLKDDGNISSNVANYFKAWNNNLNSTILEIDSIIQQLSTRIDSVTNPMSTQQFIALLQRENLLQTFVNSISRFNREAIDLNVLVKKLRPAIDLANGFRSNFNVAHSSALRSVNDNVLSYIRSSNTTFWRFIASTESLLLHLQVTNNTFMYKWPLLLEGDVVQTLHILTESVNAIQNNIFIRIGDQIKRQEKIVNQFLTFNTPHIIVANDADKITRRLLDVFEEDYCLKDFHPRFRTMTTRISTEFGECFKDQMDLENQGINILNSMTQSFLRTFITVVYKDFNMCSSYPYDKMNECLNFNAKSVAFANKFAILDVASAFIYEELGVEIDNCMNKVIHYVINNALQAECPTI